MVRKRALRGLTMVLVAAMLMALSACGGTDGGKSTGTTAAATGTAGGTTTAAQQEAFEEVQLDMLSLPSNAPGLYDQTWWGKLIKEKTGVTLNILSGGGEQGDEKLQAMMAVRELPDIVVFEEMNQVQNAVRANLIVNLDEHLDKLPNASKYIPHAMQYFRDVGSNGTGKLYALANAVGQDNMGPDPDYGPFLRWDLYKKIGMPEINTLEDYLPALKKMQELNPKNADGKKVYGFSMFKDWDGDVVFLGSTLAPMLGYDCGDDLGAFPYLQANYSTFEYKNSLDPDGLYLRSLKFYYQANQMGLLDPDSLTQTFDMAKAKADEGRVLFSWWSWFCQGYDTTEHRNAEDPSGFQFVPSKESKNVLPGTTPVGSTWAFGISANTKKLDACLRFIDLMYNPAVVTELVNGPKGLTWDVDGNGQPYLTDAGWDYYKNSGKELPDGGKLTDGISIVNSVGLAMGFVDPETGISVSCDTWPSFKEKSSSAPTKLEADWRSVYGAKTATDYLMKNSKYTPQPLAPYLAPPLPDEISVLCDEISEIVKVYSWSMIFAKNDADFDKNYKEMMEKVNGIGLGKIYEWSSTEWQKAVASANKYSE